MSASEAVRRVGGRAAGCATASARRRRAPARRAPSTREGRLPDAIDQGGARRIELVAARQCAARPGGLRISSRLSLNSVWRCWLSRPKAVKAVKLPPGPTPTSRRPPLRKVGDDGILGDADRQFQRQGDDAGAEPDARRSAAAAWARNTNGAGRPPSPSWKWCWAIQAESKPHSLGVHDLLGGQPVALGGVSPGRAGG